MSLHRLIARAKAMLLTPKSEWLAVAGEPATVGGLYKNYIVVLAAIPATFAFVRMTVVGEEVPLVGTVRTTVGAGLTSTLFGYAVALGGVYLVALIVDALAPRFGGRRDRVQALKTVAYAYTASWIAGVAQVLPTVGWIVAVAGFLYSVFLLYSGLPHTMNAPRERAAGYTVVILILALPIAFVVGAAGSGSLLSGASGDVAFDRDSPIGKLEQWRRELEEEP